MEELCLHPADHQVYFGQLLGMCDQISFPLGEWGPPWCDGVRFWACTSWRICPHAGQAGYKYVPYGPVMEVLPYLSHRALENSSLMKGTRQLLWLKLLRWLRPGSLFHCRT